MPPESFDGAAAAGPTLAQVRPDPLPDVAAGPAAGAAAALDWLGMQGLKLPIHWPQGVGATLQLPATLAAQVNLIDPQARGIHMSRLYLACEAGMGAHPLSPAALHTTLATFLASHVGLSDAARLRLEFELLLRRPALRSAELAGWRSYPVWIEAALDAHGRFAVSAGLELLYSSTCPASAALARQMTGQHFLDAFGTQSALSPHQVANWLLSPAGMPATPHAQRSRARLELVLAVTRDDAVLPLSDWIDVCEEALQTSVQTAVRRLDEQEFALRNGQNLMFCEDAARRLQSVLAADGRLLRWRAEVAHLESLHAHDAVAVVSGARI